MPLLVIVPILGQLYLWDVVFVLCVKQLTMPQQQLVNVFNQKKK